MNKTAAKKATEEFEGTVADLIALSDADKRADSSQSVLNAGMTHGEAKTILLAAIEGRDPTEKITIWKSDPYSRTGRMKRTGDAMLVQNFYREFS